MIEKTVLLSKSTPITTMKQVGKDLAKTTENIAQKAEVSLSNKTVTGDILLAQLPSIRKTALRNVPATKEDIIYSANNSPIFKNVKNELLEMVDKEPDTIKTLSKLTDSRGKVILSAEDIGETLLDMKAFPKYKDNLLKDLKNPESIKFLETVLQDAEKYCGNRPFSMRRALAYDIPR